MLNVYPQRSTDPAGMHDAHDPVLQAENERHIGEFLDGRPLTLLAAWGGEPIETRPYLLPMLGGIVAVTDASGCEWISIGDLGRRGHPPRHPSRARYDWPLQPFDVKGGYLAR